jgi:hypothetical protein
MTALRGAALDYAAAGYEVFPLRGKLPHGNCPECSPRNRRYREHAAADCDHELCHGLLAATTDPARVEGWWTRWPKGNIGARVPTSMVVLDVDPRHDGDRRLANLVAKHGPLPATRVSYSGRGDGGRHLWWLHPGGTPTAVRLGDGLDLKTHHGYVVLPPSVHPDSGRPYRWAEPVCDPAPMPGWLRRYVLPPPAAQRPPARLRVHRDPGTSSIEAFNERETWTGILEPHGWTCRDANGDKDGARWQHAKATHAVSATIRHGCLFVYSESTPFRATGASDPHGYTRFRAWAVLEHGGDLSAAARALREAS